MGATVQYVNFISKKNLLVVRAATVPRDKGPRATEDGKKIFLTHYPDMARSMAKSGDCDAVFYGHDHTTLFETLDNGCVLANPGEVAASTTNRCTFMVWDTETNDIQTYDVGEHSNQSME